MYSFSAINLAVLPFVHTTLPLTGASKALGLGISRSHKRVSPKKKPTKVPLRLRLREQQPQYHQSSLQLGEGGEEGARADPNPQWLPLALSLSSSSAPCCPRPQSRPHCCSAAASRPRRRASTRSGGRPPRRGTARPRATAATVNTLSSAPQLPNPYHAELIISRILQLLLYLLLSQRSIDFLYRVRKKMFFLW